MSDLISRQAAIDTLHMDTSIIPYKKAREYADATILEIRNRLEDLPSAQPEPKRGEWTPIHKGERGFSAGDFRCSVCHQPNKCYTMTNYCSHCGAYMKPTEKNDQ